MINKKIKRFDFESNKLVDVVEGTGLDFWDNADIVFLMERLRQSLIDSLGVTLQQFNDNQ